MNALLPTLASALTSLVLAAPLGAQESSAPARSEGQACTCTCADCVAKHGARAADEAPIAVIVEVVDVTKEPEAVNSVEGDPVQAEASAAPTIARLIEVVDAAEEAREVSPSEAPGAVAEVRSALAAAERGYMGIELRMQEGRPAVDAALPGSPAAAAGLQEGDVVTSIDRRAVTDGESLSAAMAETKAGERVEVQVLRDGEPLGFTVELGSMSVFGTAARPEPRAEPNVDLKRKLRQLEREVAELRREVERLERQLAGR